MTGVYKIGGSIIEDASAIESFCRDFAALEGPRILVHGGGPMANGMLSRLGIPVRKIQGRRITDPETLEIVTMVYAGWCNKRIVSLLQSFGCNAAGFSGCDADLIRAEKRPPVEIDGEMVDFGLVGDVSKKSVNIAVIREILSAGIVPVLSPVNHDGRGNLLNTNADTIASSVAAALGTDLVVCFDKGGVLEDPSDPDSVIKEITPESYAAMKAAGTITGGMIPKIDNAFKALREGALSVTLKSPSALMADAGTRISLK